MGAWFRWLKELWLGYKQAGQNVERATAVIALGTTHLFNIVGGRVLMTQIVDEITIVMQGIATTLRLSSDPTLGTTRNICQDLDVNAYAVNDLLGITGINTDAMLPPATGGSIEGQTVPVVLKAGTLDLIAGAANTGSVRWTLKYIPIDAGAVVQAA
ncbi:MAG: hypothetical protein PHQ43_13220 [Dehalococcoidales bacterium]|nr:hypothetical protein [Dehalococcoidales bacterium]